MREEWREGESGHRETHSRRASQEPEVAPEIGEWREGKVAGEKAARLS